MSRVTYTDMSATAPQEALRGSDHVRIVSAEEEGFGLNTLPNGVYGFTYSPGIANAPLFAVPRYRSFEVHKLPNGEVFLIGFATADDAGRIESVRDEITIRVQPQPED